MTWDDHASGSADAGSSYYLADSEDWNSLELFLDLNEGFALVFCLVAGEGGELVCRHAVEDLLRRAGKTLLDLSPSTQDDLRYLANKLLHPALTAETGAVWVGKVVATDNPAQPEWADAWREGMARINQFRNPVIREIPLPLIFCGAPWLQAAVSESAPDLWSVRSIVTRLEPRVQPGSGALPSIRRRTAPAANSAPDPILALHDSDRLGGSADNSLALARSLLRAGEGFIARYQFQDAVEPLRRALDIRRAAEDNPREIAEAAFALARAFNRLDRNEEAVGLLQEARDLYREISDLRGEANALRSLGVIALAHAESEKAQYFSKGALDLFRQTDDILGQARSIGSLGDAARNFGRLSEAAEQYHQAIALFHRAGDLAGEGNFTRALGAISLSQGDQPSARKHFERALHLSRETQDRWGEAQAIRALGDLAAGTGDYSEARVHYDQAAAMFHPIDRFGEADCEMGLSNVLLRTGERDEALVHAERALSLYSSLGDVRARGWAFLRRGDIQRSRLEAGAARGDFESALELFDQTGEGLGEANAHARFGDLEFGQKNYGAAESHYGEALTLFRRVADTRGEANSLKVLGDLMVRLNRLDDALTRYEEALSLYLRLGNLRNAAHASREVAETLLTMGRAAEATDRLREALLLAQRAGDPLSAASMMRRLAKTAGAGPEREQLVAGAASVYRELKREDLLVDLRKEFPEPSGP